MIRWAMPWCATHRVLLAQEPRVDVGCLGCLVKDPGRVVVFSAKMQVPVDRVEHVDGPGETTIGGEHTVAAVLRSIELLLTSHRLRTLPAARLSGMAR
jgi:hypothetical protein